jgi:hypothetical protein
MNQRLTKVTVVVMLLVLLATVATSGALAAPARQGAACAQDYNVQADDWLSKLAEKQYGDPLVYSVIVDATNKAAETDSSYATIANPDLIEIGWKLCLPATAEMGMMAETSMMDQEAMAGSEQMDTMAGSEQMDTMAGSEAMMMGEKSLFNVRIENVAAETGLVSPLAPGVWAVSATGEPLFTAGQPDRGQGLEALAEDGDPSSLAAALAGQANVAGSGVFDTPVGTANPGILLPGSAYEFTIEAAPGDHLVFATMLVQSNDLFFAPGGAGIALFDASGQPVTGDVTGQVSLWDAGTEVNQAPGSGADQAPRQAGPNIGAAENGVVQLVSDSFTYPAAAQLIRVTISAGQ